jgi:N-acetylmuramoyl-L-alanine amidase
MKWEGKENEIKSIRQKTDLENLPVVLAIAVLISLRPMLYRNVSMVQAITSSDVILIDPGHGGMDGGASSAAGVTEKEINLSIAFYLKELAEADGWKVVMTREEE